MQACGYGKTALMLGIVELLARFGTAFLSMKLHSFNMAVAGDAAAWVTAGVFSIILYVFVMKQLREKTA